MVMENIRQTAITLVSYMGKVKEVRFAYYWKGVNGIVPQHPASGPDVTFIYSPLNEGIVPH